jgi:DNA-binding transcriptional LysR family regulator
MMNIPTDLLRTFVAVTDLRSFTKAAQSLGVTQPAVSAQIKRLHALLGSDLLDKSAPGVSLTPMGELVVTYARRLLSINDQILHLADPASSAQTLRIAVPEDLFGAEVAWTLDRCRERWPHIRYHVSSGYSDTMVRKVRQGELDLAVAFSSAPILDAQHSWSESLAWIRGQNFTLDSQAPVPLVSYGDECVYHRAAVAALDQAGRDSDLVFTGSGLLSIAAAVRAGSGVTVLARNRFLAPDLVVWDDGPLPPLPALHCGVHVRDGGDREIIEQLAEAIATALRPADHRAASPAPATTGSAA